jgi:acetyl-CoA C-acetyltransferase
MHTGLEPLMETPVIGHRLRVSPGEPNIAALI